MAFRVIPCLVFKKIVFGSKVTTLLNMLELSLDDLEKSSVKQVPEKSALVGSLD